MYVAGPYSRTRYAGTGYSAHPRTSVLAYLPYVRPCRTRRCGVPAYVLAYSPVRTCRMYARRTCRTYRLTYIPVPTPVHPEKGNHVMSELPAIHLTDEQRLRLLRCAKAALEDIPLPFTGSRQWEITAHFEDILNLDSLVYRMSLPVTEYPSGNDVSMPICDVPARSLPGITQEDIDREWSRAVAVIVDQLTPEDSKLGT